MQTDHVMSRYGVSVLLAEEGKCVIAVTHSVDFSEKADVVYRLEKHKLVRF